MNPLQALWATLVIVSLLYLVVLAWSEIAHRRRRLRMHRQLMDELKAAQRNREWLERMR